MENTKKNLRDMSFLILLLAGLSLVREIVKFAFGGYNATNVNIPEGMTEALVNVAVIIAFALSLVLLLPQVYVGLKGLKMSREPDGSKAHIIWATILLVCSILGALSIVTTITRGSIASNIIGLVDVLLDVIIYFCFIKYAKALRVMPQ